MNGQKEAAQAAGEPAAHTGAPRLTLGVATYRRPDELGRLPPLLVGQADRVVQLGLVSSARVLVVDNDAAGSARMVVDSFGPQVDYVVEPRSGVASARNRVLDEAGTDLLVFVDDDETPACDEWLAQLLATLAAQQAQAVAGPVRTVMPAAPDPWVVAGEFFARGHRVGLPTGALIERAATNNLLLDLRFVRRSGVRFDDAFGRSGGEDSLFTAQLHAAGARLCWCAEAVMLDHLPPERQSRAYALERTRVMASAGVRVNVALARTSRARMRARVRGLVVGSARVTLGAGRLLTAAVVGSVRLDAVGTREVNRGRGAIAASLGRVMVPYGHD